MIQLDYITLNSQLVPINSDSSHGKFPLWNISKIPQLNFPWKFTGNVPEMFRPFATLDIITKSIENLKWIIMLRIKYIFSFVYCLIKPK